jgi:hypothetical protein
MKLAIVVPVHHRPHNAERFMKSLRETLPVQHDAAVFALAAHGDEDTGQAWYLFGAEVVYGDDESFPKKAQDFYDEIVESADRPEYILLIGDDVRFIGGWYEAFIKAAEGSPAAGLISTNDMGNPYVTSGSHATHPIFRVTYIEKQGASWDGPGTICHTGYRHSWVDEEWSTKAKHDGAFLYAPNCKIEHLHPTWNKGQQDETYAIARQYLLDDHDLYQRRHEHAKTQGWA